MALKWKSIHKSMTEQTESPQNRSELGRVIAMTWSCQSNLCGPTQVSHSNSIPRKTVAPEAVTRRFYLFRWLRLVNNLYCSF